MREVNKITPVSLFLPTPTLLCQHCKSIPNQPIELLPCHHLICVTCIEKITETSILTCTCNSATQNANTISIPHPVILKLLSSLLLKHCDQVIELGHLCNHLESNCTSHPYPTSQYNCYWKYPSGKQ